MAGTIKEKPKSQRGEVPFFGQNSQREYMAFGCPTASDLVALVIASPSVVPPVDTVNGAAIFIEKFTYQEFGGGCWDVSAYYKGLGAQWRLSADTTGGTRKLNYSYATIASYDCSGAFGTPTDHGGAIGVTSQGVDGVDIIDPKFDLTINATLKLSQLAASYLLVLRDLTGRVNAAPYAINYKGQFIQFDTEELLFKGVSFNQTSTDDLDITYKFSGQKSIVANDNLSIGVASPILKQGWQYLWVEYSEVTTADAVTRKPKYAYIERVFKTGDFTQFVL
jgi:hypothetical protein